MDFRSAYAHGFARVAACTLPVAVADPAANAARVLEQARACNDDGAAVAVFPELTLSGYAIDDLVMQDALLDAVLTAVDTVVEGSRDLRPVLVVGAPLRVDNRLYNCAVVVHRGEVLGVAPATPSKKSRAMATDSASMTVLRPARITQPTNGSGWASSQSMLQPWASARSAASIAVSWSRKNRWCTKRASRPSSPRPAIACSTIASAG